MIEAIGYMAIGTFFALLVPFLKAWAESKKTWVGLTDEEIEQLAKWADEHGHDGWHLEYGRAIEAKLKEKNT